MHATKLNEDRPSLSKSDKLTSKVYLRIYYLLQERGCYLHYCIMADFFSCETNISYPRYTYNVLQIAGTLSAFLLKILRRYRVSQDICRVLFSWLHRQFLKLLDEEVLLLH